MELTAGGILSRMWATVRARFGPLLGMWALYLVLQIGFTFGFMMFAGLGAVAGAGIVGPDSGGAAALGGGMIVMMILFYLVYLAIYVAGYASLAHLASPLVTPNFGESLGMGARAALPLLGATLLLLFGYFILAIPMGLLFAAFGSAGEVAPLLFGLLLLPVLVYLGCRLSILFPLATVEGIRSPVALVTRSWQLTRARVLPIFLAILVFLLIALVLVVLVFLPAFGPLLTGGAPDADVGIAMMLLSIIGVLVLTVVLTIMGAALGSAIHAGLSDVSGETYSETFA